MRTIALLMFGVLAASAPAVAAPPRIVKIAPTNGATDVPAGPIEIRIEFDQDMGSGASFCFVDVPSSVPTATAHSRWLTPRTIVASMILEPGRRYATDLNCAESSAFASRTGELLSPTRYELVTAGHLDAAARLQELGITALPPPDQLGASRYPDAAVDAVAIGGDRVATSFDNLDDLAWLGPIARDHKVVLFGETHMFQTINHLAERTCFALNRYDDYRLLSLEEQHSSGPYYDYYVGLCDDSEADAFFRAELDRRIMSPPRQELLRDVRRWNCSHPTRRLHVRTHDVEHDYRDTIANVIDPYFRQLGADHVIEAPPPADPGELLATLERWLADAKAKHLTGAYPFITADFIEDVIANIRSSMLVTDPARDVYRQRAIIRNLTDRRFLGAFFDGKVMLYGGANHMANQHPDLDGANFMREGSYLAFELPATRGRTWSVCARGYAYSFGDAGNVDLHKRASGGSGHDLYTRIRAAFREGLVSRSSFYLLFDGALDDFDKLVLGRANALGGGPIRVRRFDWNTLASAAAAISPVATGWLRYERAQYTDYDAALIVPTSPIELLRP